MQSISSISSISNTSNKGGNPTLLASTFFAPLTATVTQSKGTGTPTFERASRQCYFDINGVLRQEQTDNVAVFESNGIKLEPASSNKCTCYSVPRADQLGAELVTGNNSTMGGANSWVSNGTLGAFDINTTVSGKLYMLGDGASDRVALASISTTGKYYLVSAKVRLNSGSAVAIKIATLFTNPLCYVEFTPTSTEATYTGYILADGSNIYIGNGTGFAGTAYEIDDVSIKEAIDYVGTKAYHNGTAFQNPIPNMTLSGDTAATLSIVTDQTALEAAGLGSITNGYKVYKLDNSLGSATSIVKIGGTVGTVTDLAISAYMRQGIASTKFAAQLETKGSALSGFKPLTQEWVKAKKENLATIATTDQLLFTADEGGIGYFIIPQVEASPFATSPMLTAGTAASRIRTRLQYPMAGNMPTGLQHIQLSFSTAGFIAGTKQILWTSRADASNEVSIWHNGVIVAFEKKVSGVSEYVTSALTPTLGTSYLVDAYIYADYKMGLAVNGVLQTGTLGSNELTEPINISTGWATDSTSTIATSTSFTSTVANGYIYKNPIITALRHKVSISTLVCTTTAGNAQLQASGTSIEALATGGVALTTIGVQLNADSSLIRARTSGATLTITSFTQQLIYNNSTTLAPVFGSTMEVGSSNELLSINGNIKNLRIMRR